MRKTIPAKTVNFVVERAKSKCELCNQPFDGRRCEIDHYPVPVALGGTNEPDNLRALCPPCHRFVTAKTDIPRIAKAKRIHVKNTVKRPSNWPKRSFTNA